MKIALSRPARAAATLLLALLVVPLPDGASAAVATAGRAQRAAEAGWVARPIAASHVRARDRAALSGLPGSAQLAYHPRTGRVRLLSGTPDRPLASGPAAVMSGEQALGPADARARARRFVERYGELFGLADAAHELRAGRVQRYHTLASTEGRRAAADPGGAAGQPSNLTVRFDQVRNGLPVMGGQLIVQLSAAGEVISAAGEVLPTVSVAPLRARLSAGQAARVAASRLAREAGRPASAVTTRPEGLVLYDPRLMDGPADVAPGPRLAWRIDARLPEGEGHAAEHRLIVVDARLGHVLASIGRRYTVDRLICDNRSVPGRSYRCGPPYARSEGDPATGVAEVDAAYRLLGVVDEFLASRFGRDGLDDRGARLKATVRYCASYGCPWRNAEWKWAEQQAIFGAGWAKADDIVAHELTHGLLDHESPLFYQYQSGAINESFADVFGELVDLSYVGGTDTAASAWRIGEDTPVGAFRDMQDPARFGHPDRVRSPRWHVSAADDGGVHRNSGVGNKAASLIADGGSFQGYRIKGIGRTRTARVYYQALTTRLTPAANYIDLADALVAACADLAGRDGMTMAHCASVRDATRATQMALPPLSRAPARAPVCAAGRRAVDAFADDLEDPASGTWVSQRLVGTRKGWFYPQNPNTDPSWDATWASSGRRNFYAPNYAARSDTVMQTRSAVRIPEQAYLRFEHGYSFDADDGRRYDGGIVEVKVDGGPWRGVKALFTHGGYGGRIARGYGSPLAGQRAFSADSHGWSSARVDLGAFAGRWLKLRFRMASDRTVGGRGWYIDDIRIYTCARDTDRPSGTLLIDGGAASTADPRVSLTVTAGDTTTWVTHLRVAGGGRLNDDGLLANGITVPFRERLAWDLADTTFGGSGEPGRRTVHAQVRDAAGNWSDVFSDDIELRPRAQGGAAAADAPSGDVPPSDAPTDDPQTGAEQSG